MLSHYLHIALLLLGGLGVTVVASAFLLMARFPEVVYPSNDIEPEDDD
jgi:hypothetical protein